MAREEPRRRENALGGISQEKLRQAEHHLIASMARTKE
jgi:hypothetical protein